MNRVCCGAVKIFTENKSSPLCIFYKFGGICDKEYHGLRRASRWFCKFYCSKAVIVGLINPKVDFINKYLYKIPPLRAMCSEAGGVISRIRESVFVRNRNYASLQSLVNSSMAASSSGPSAAMVTVSPHFTARPITQRSSSCRRLCVLMS